MRARKSYSDILRDPRWQKKRLDILNRDGFTCRFCQRQDQELHVHHGYYAKDKMPWEYEEWSLTTLCKACHELLEAHLIQIKMALARIIYANRFYDFFADFRKFIGINPKARKPTEPCSTEELNQWVKIRVSQSIKDRVLAARSHEEAIAALAELSGGKDAEYQP